MCYNYNTCRVCLFTATRSQSTPPPARRFHLVRIVFTLVVCYFRFFFFFTLIILQPSPILNVKRYLQCSLDTRRIYVYFLYSIRVRSNYGVCLTPPSSRSPLSAYHRQISVSIRLFFSPFFLRYCIKTKREKILTKRV